MSMRADEFRGLVDQGRLREVVRRAVDEAMAAEKAMDSGEMRRAMASIDASRGELAQIDRAKIHAEVEAAMAEVRNAHIEETVDRATAELRSPEFRESIRRAARDAARAATDALDHLDPPPPSR
jgi:diacylglycerol kinase